MADFAPHSRRCLFCSPTRVAEETAALFCSLAEKWRRISAQHLSNVLVFFHAMFYYDATPPEDAIRDYRLEIPVDSVAAVAAIFGAKCAPSCHNDVARAYYHSRFEDASPHERRYRWIFSAPTGEKRRKCLPESRRDAALPLTLKRIYAYYMAIFNTAVFFTPPSRR